MQSTSLNVVEVAYRINAAQKSLGLLTFNQMTDLVMDQFPEIKDTDDARKWIARAFACLLIR